jgi:protocatechuate 3,4-dioxygenase alpha subunit
MRNNEESPMDLTPTPSQTAGPYLHLGLTDRRRISCVAGEGAKGERVWITFRVLDGDGVPVSDAMIELWQADSEGHYKTPGTSLDAGFCGFGRLATAPENGWCTFETIRPGRVRGPDGTFQAPHINVSVLGRGLLKRLSTRVYFADEAANAKDPVLTLVPENRRATLIAQPDPTRTGGWVFEIRFRGEGETVFFDV